MSITPSDYGQVCCITCNGATKVSGSHSDYMAVLTHVNFPSSALDLDGGLNIASDGRDLKACLNEDGTGQIPIHIVHIALNNNPALSMIKVKVKIPSLTSVDLPIYFFYNRAGDSMAGVDDTYGQHAVYSSSIKTMWDLTEQGDSSTDGIYKDSTSNNNDGRGGYNNQFPDLVTGGLYTKQSFSQNGGDPNGDLIIFPDSNSLDCSGAFSVIFGVNKSSSCSGLYNTLGNKGESDFTHNNWFIQSRSSDKIRVVGRYNTGSTTAFDITSVNAIADDVDHIIAFTFNGTVGANGAILYLDGGLDTQVTSNSASLAVSTEPFQIGISASAFNSPLYYGTTGYFWDYMILDGAVSADFVTTVTNNLSDVAGFWTTGTPYDPGSDSNSSAWWMLMA